MDGFIERQVRRTNRNLLLINLAVLVSVGLVAYSQRGYLCNFFAGPTPLTIRDLNREAPARGDKGNFYKIDVTKSVDTGFQEVEQRVDRDSKAAGSEKVTAEYIAVPFQGRALLVRVHPTRRQGTFEGELIALGPEVRHNFLEPLIAQDPRYKGVFFPVLLDAIDYRAGGFFGISIGFVLLILAGWNLRKWLVRQGDSAKHPLIASISLYGDPAALVPRIDTEVAASPQTFKSVRLLPEWLLAPRFFRCDVFRLQEIVWVYPKVIRHYTYFIPTGKTHALVIHDSRGQSLEVLRGAKERLVKDLMSAIAQTVPGAVYGYSAELKRAWSKDRPGFLAAVNEQTQAALRSSSAR